MKRPQLITIVISLLVTTGIYFFARTTPKKKVVAATQHSADDGHDHGAEDAGLSIDTILNLAKKQLTEEQLIRITTLENSISRGLSLIHI